MTTDASPPVDIDALLDALDLDNVQVKGWLQSSGWWHEEGDRPDCEDEHCGRGECVKADPLLGVRTDTDEIGLARAFEQLHKLAHPDEPLHLSFCKSEPCRSLPWAVVNEIAKVA